MKHWKPNDRTVEAGLLGVGIFLVVGWLFHWGYLPPDDALRHAAYAVSDHTWNEILVLRSSMDTPAMDSHPGWHKTLRFLHGFGFSKERLVLFPTLLFSLTLLLLPLVFLRAPWVWALTLVVLSSAQPNAFLRVFNGRPYWVTALTMGMMLGGWQLLPSQSEKRRLLYVGVFLGTAAAVYVHSTWYLLSMPLLVCFSKSRFREWCQFSMVVCLGILAGAALTGDGLHYLAFQLEHLYRALGSLRPGDYVVGEFRPLSWLNSLMGILGILAVLVYWKRKPEARLNTPFLRMAVLGWLLSVLNGRFWYDWGFVAAAIALAQVIQQLFDDVWPIPSWIRRSAVVVGCVALIPLLTRSPWGRTWTDWSAEDHEAALHRAQESSISWMPEDHGIVYATSMRVFFYWFYAFPEQSWKYAPGYEPGLLPDDDLRVFRQWNASREDSLLFAWTSKLRLQDRLVVWGEPEDPPPALPLEWQLIPPTYWVGRIPQPNLSEGLLQPAGE